MGSVTKHAAGACRQQGPWGTQAAPKAIPAPGYRNLAKPHGFPDRLLRVDSSWTQTAAERSEKPGQMPGLGGGRCSCRAAPPAGGLAYLLSGPGTHSLRPGEHSTCVCTHVLHRCAGCGGMCALQDMKLPSPPGAQSVSHGVLLGERCPHHVPPHRPEPCQPHTAKTLPHHRVPQGLRGHGDKAFQGICQLQELNKCHLDSWLGLTSSNNNQN